MVPIMNRKGSQLQSPAMPIVVTICQPNIYCPSFRAIKTLKSNPRILIDPEKVARENEIRRSETNLPTTLTHPLPHPQTHQTVAFMDLRFLKISACFGLASLLGLLAAPALAQEADVRFNRDIQPILAKKCFACHGPGQAESSLRLDQAQSATGEADSGSIAIVPGKPGESELLRRVLSHDEFDKMPPEGPSVTEEEAAILRQWIASGAEYEGHWAFEPVEDPKVPEIQNDDWSRNEIDQFILARLQANNLTPNEPASRRSLIRRAYYNLTGLPPTQEEVQAFEADDSPDAWEKLIDRLLASQRYGEKWGRHWLDLVRFAETNSYERDGVKPNAWRYRDYVIQAFNDNVPYDQFVIEQLAGDELPNPTREQIVATGYYRLGVWDDEPADPVQHEYDQYDDLISTTGKTFLAVTINCARCHEHKIDPISNENYYEFLAFFRDLKPYGTRGSVAWSQVEISEDETKQKHNEFDRKVRQAEQKVTQILDDAVQQLPKKQQVGRKKRDQRKLYERAEKQIAELLPARVDEFKEALKLRDSLYELRKSLPAREFAMAVTTDTNVPKTTVMMRGNPHVPGAEVEPAYPVFYNQERPKIVAPEGSSDKVGRRMTLAKWIASPDNMLTARVMVNRIWQYQFGRGIVQSSSNFGQLGTPPTHPELLDWLAVEFVRSEWDIKHMQKLLMMTAAYQMDSSGSESGLAKDPGNNFFWRFNPRRLSAEEVRDSILAVNGRLNEKMYGPGFYAKISQEVMAGQSKPGDGWGESPYSEQARRSVYIHVKRSLVTPILSSFDFPETDAPCEDRFVTTQPAQALAMINGEFANMQARELAERVRKAGAESAEDRMKQAISFVLARDATARDLEIGRSLMNDLQSNHQLDAEQAFDLYCLMLINLNEFFFID